MYISLSPICKEKAMVRIQPLSEKQIQQKHNEKNKNSNSNSKWQ